MESEAEIEQEEESSGWSHESELSELIEEENLIMTNEVEEEHGDTPTATTVQLGKLQVPLIEEGQSNAMEGILKPMYPKEEWADLPADSRRKAFDKIEKPIFEDKLKMYTVSATALDALNDAVAVLSKIERLGHHFAKYDLTCVVDILKFDPNHPRDVSKHSSINLLEHMESVTARDVANSNKFIRKYVDHTKAGYLEYALGIMLNFMQNNCDDELNAKVLEEYSQYPEEEQGGNLYLFHALHLIYHNSEQECLALSNTLVNLKITDIPGEDVTSFVTKYRAGMTFLKRSNSYKDADGKVHYKYIRADSMQLLLAVLSSTSTEEFNEVFSWAKVAITINQMGETEGPRLGQDDSLFGNDLVKQLEDLLSSAQSQYLVLSSQAKWNGTSTPGLSTFTVIPTCWNCGNQGHTVTKCQKPLNQAVIDKNRKGFRDARGGSRGRGTGRGGRGRGNSTGKWRRPTPEEHNKRVIDGKWHNYNPSANGGRGHWYVMDPQPGGQSATRTPTAAPAVAPAPAPTPAPAPAPPTTSMATPGMTSVAQTSIDAARQAARKQALAAQLKRDQALYTQHLEEFKSLE